MVLYNQQPPLNDLSKSKDDKKWMIDRCNEGGEERGEESGEERTIC